MSHKNLFSVTLVAAGLLATIPVCAAPKSAAQKRPTTPPNPSAPPASLTLDQLPTGKRITVPPLGTQQNVGSEPMNMVLTPDGRLALVSDMRYRRVKSPALSA